MRGIRPWTERPHMSPLSPPVSGKRVSVVASEVVPDPLGGVRARNLVGSSPWSGKAPWAKLPGVFAQLVGRQGCGARSGASGDHGLTRNPSTVSTLVIVQEAPHLVTVGPRRATAPRKRLESLHRGLSRGGSRSGEGFAVSARPRTCIGSWADVGSPIRLRRLGDGSLRGGRGSRCGASIRRPRGTRRRVNSAVARSRRRTSIRCASSAPKTSSTAPSSSAHTHGASVRHGEEERRNRQNRPA